MNQHFDDIPPFDDAAQEREWLRQETALRRERLNLDPAGDDERGKQYRLLARALRESPPDGLPADFAMRVAARAASSHSVGVEVVLVIVLVSAMVVAAGFAVATYGAKMLRQKLEVNQEFPARSGELRALARPGPMEE